MVLPPTPEQRVPRQRKHLSADALYGDIKGSGVFVCSIVRKK